MSRYEEDIALFEELKAGKIEAVSYLFETHRKWLMIAALSILGKGDDMEAQDVVQDFFLDFWEKKLYKQINQPYSIKSYLHRSIHNRCLDKLRQNKVSQKRMDKFSTMAATLQLPCNRLENDELRLQLDAAIAEVPRLSARVFKLTYLEEKSRNEVASEMGISPNTVKNQLVRAIKILRERLKNTGF